MGVAVSVCCNVLGSCNVGEFWLGGVVTKLELSCKVDLWFLAEVKMTDGFPSHLPCNNPNWDFYTFLRIEKWRENGKET